MCEKPSFKKLCDFLCSRESVSAWCVLAWNLVASLGLWRRVLNKTADFPGSAISLIPNKVAGASWWQHMGDGCSVPLFMWFHTTHHAHILVCLAHFPRVCPACGSSWSLWHNKCTWTHLANVSATPSLPSDSVPIFSQISSVANPCDGGFFCFLLQKKPWKNICYIFCLLHRFKEEGFHSNAVKISPHVKPSQVPAAYHCHVFFCNLAAKDQTDLCKI